MVSEVAAGTYHMDFGQLELNFIIDFDHLCKIHYIMSGAHLKINGLIMVRFT